MKLPRYMVQLLRANVEAFNRQSKSTTALMPVLPKVLIEQCDTALELHDEVERLRGDIDALVTVLEDITSPEAK